MCDCDNEPVLTKQCAVRVRERKPSLAIAVLVAVGEVAVALKIGVALTSLGAGHIKVVVIAFDIEPRGRVRQLRCSVVAALLLLLLLCAAKPHATARRSPLLRIVSAAVVAMCWYVCHSSSHCAERGVS